MYVLHRVVFDLHQDGEEGFDDGGDVVIGLLLIDVGKGRFVGLFIVISESYEEDHHDCVGNVISLLDNEVVVA